MSNYVYVLVEDNTIDYIERVLVFASLEQANNKLLELKEDFECRVNVDTPYYVVEEETDKNNDTMFSYCVYEDGDYYNHHYCLTIYQRDIID